MSTILSIESSPRDGDSASRAIARRFVHAFADRTPHATLDTLDVWRTPIPEFDGDALQAKYAALHGVERTPAQAAAWEELSRLAYRVRDADLLVLGVPMWNFGIPYKLKHLIDAVSQKDLLFTFDERGFGGLARAKHAVVVYARGIDYGPDATFGTPAPQWDQQKPYLDIWLRFIGIADVRSIVVEKTLMGPDAERERSRGIAEADALARELAPVFS